MSKEIADLKKRLKRARRTLIFMDDYFQMQAAFAKAGVISPGYTWQECYKDVSNMASKMV